MTASLEARAAAREAEEEEELEEEEDVLPHSLTATKIVPAVVFDR